MKILLNVNNFNEYEENFFHEILDIISSFVDFNDTSELSIVLSEDEFIRDLNRNYRGKDYATDVLSFPMGEEYMLGDIVISIETARRQARTSGISLNSEVAFLFIHGFLHLLGFDHEDAAGNELSEAEEMYALQEEIWQSWEESFEK